MENDPEAWQFLCHFTVTPKKSVFRGADSGVRRKHGTKKPVEDFLQLEAI